MLKFLFVVLFSLITDKVWSQTTGVELELTSSLIIQSGVEVDISSTPIEMSNPCNYIALNPDSCSFNSTTSIMTVVYDLDVVPSIPSGKKGILNIDIEHLLTNSFEQVRILENGVPVGSSLEFTSNTTKSYSIEFKIKINGSNVSQNPQVSINFFLEETTI